MVSPASEPAPLENGPRESATKAPLAIELAYDRRVNHASQQNDVPVIKRLVLSNKTEKPLEDLEVRVTIASGLATPCVQHVARIPGGGALNLQIADLRLDPSRLAGQIEREATELLVQVTRGETLLLKLAYPLLVLAHNEWGGLQTLPEILGAFVFPNHPAVAALLSRASTQLMEATGSGALSGYQSGDPSRVRAMARACFEALQERKIRYSNPPASFEEEGQKIRDPGQIVELRLGTCLDLALLLAALLEGAGLHPLIFITKGHAFGGVWLREESFAEPAVDDLARVRKRIKLQDMLALEATSLTLTPEVSFESSQQEAWRHLQDPAAFLMAIDLKTARSLGIRPLPLHASRATFPDPKKVGPAPVVPVEGSAPAGNQPQETPPLPAKPQGAPQESVQPKAAPAQVPRPSEPGADRLDHWKKKLLDLSLRNRLLNLRENKRTLPLLCQDLGAFEDALAAGQAFSILPRPRLMDEDSPRSLEVHRARTQEDALAAFLAEDLEARRLHAPLPEEEVKRRLLEIYRKSKTAIEESGANTLYLALGFLSWFQGTNSDQVRKAPILLLPVRLIRRSIREGYKLQASDDEVRINVTLLEMLQQDFDLDVSHLDELPEDASGVDLPRILNNFRRAIQNMDRWDVLEEAALGLFSFTKFLMWRDLQERAQDLLKNPVVAHLVEKPGEPFDPQGSFPEPRSLDAKWPPEECFCPLDADSSQLAAIRAAGSGKSFVLQGPPGTGKSQTITNLIAHALAKGQKVLFVAEKMAALNVVHKRLTTLGLAPFCLELHSHKANKKAVLQQLQSALDFTGQEAPAPWAQASHSLFEARRELNRLVEILHRPRPLGQSVFQATGRLASLRQTCKVSLKIKDPLTVDEEHYQQWQELVAVLATAGQALGEVQGHPLAAVEREEWVSQLEETVRETGSRLTAALKEVRSVLLDMASSLDMPREWDPSREQFLALGSMPALLRSSPGPPRALLLEPGWKDVVEVLRSWADRVKERNKLWEKLSAGWLPTLLEQDLGSLYAKLLRVKKSPPPFSWWGIWRLKGKLKPCRKPAGGKRQESLAQDLHTAIQIQGADRAFAGEEAALPRRLLGSWWQESQSSPPEILALLEWAGRFRETLLTLSSGPLEEAGKIRERLLALATSERDLAAREAPLGRKLATFEKALQQLSEIQTQLAALLDLNQELALGATEAPAFLSHLASLAAGFVEHRRHLGDWCSWRRARTKAAKAGLEELALLLEHGQGQPEELERIFERSFLDMWLSQATDEEPILRRFNSAEQARRIQHFRELDQQQLGLAREVVQARLGASLPQAGGPASKNSEVGILRRQIRLQRRHMPLRKLIRTLPNLLPRLKPCFLMSPLSVAQYLEANHPLFDLVVFDEASQIPVWDAIGPIARGQRLVVVGDSKQLPPTNFFNRLDREDVGDEEELPDVESILDECEASGLPSMSLLWHYRSRHESLIAFSNFHYYQNRLLTFPNAAAKAEGLGVSLHFCANGIYDRGRSRTNKAEARAIVAEIQRRLGSPREKNFSLGVVAFSQAQQNLIEDLLDEARRQHPEMERAFGEGASEPVFVKNLENVQGDERDVILFSICYGPDLNGRVSHAFGPLNRDGGERRLNVAITRARRELLVFSSLHADQIDLSRTRAVGVRHLKGYLDYAERGAVALAQAISVNPDADFESPFEQEVGEALRARGLLVDLQVGCSHYRIDLAIRDPERPGRYLLGIECDGATYHSSATARDRDRLREQVLKNLGWTLHRIWSTDWWRDPEHEIEKLEEALKRARATRSLEPAKPALRASEEPPGQPPGRGPSASPSLPPLPAHGSGDLLAGNARLSAAPVAGETSPASAHGPKRPYPKVEQAPLLGSPEAFYDRRFQEPLQRRILEVVQEEAPLHAQLLARRAAASFGLKRVTTRLLARVEQVMAAIPSKKRPRARGSFLWLPQMEPASYLLFRIPAGDGDAPRQPEEIPPVELANAAFFILQNQISLPFLDLQRELAHLFGFGRLGKKIQAVTQSGIMALASQGRCILEGEQVSLPSGEKP